MRSGSRRISGRAGFTLHFQCDFLLGSQLVVGFRHPFEQGQRRHRLPVESQFPGIRLGKRPQILHQPLEMLDFGMDGVETFGRRFEHAIAHGFHVTADDRQRAAQVVGDVGGHLAAGQVETVEVGAHLVEGSRQFPQFIAGFYRGHAA